MNKQFNHNVAAMRAALDRLSCEAYTIITEFLNARGGRYDFPECDAPQIGGYPAVRLYRNDVAALVETRAEIATLRELTRLELVDLAEYVNNIDE